MTIAKRGFASLLLLVLTAGLLAPAPVFAEFSGLPSGFEDQDFVSGVQLPTAFDWLPNDDMLITSKPGELFRADADGENLTELDFAIEVCPDGERGLLGVAVDPDFDESGFIFLYYTAEVGIGCVNRVARFSLGPGNTASLDKILIDDIGSPASNHNGGDLQFDRNDLLYVSVGDGKVGSNARRLDVLNGKILRIDRDGNIPAGNPFTGASSRVCGATGSAQGDSERIEAEKKSKKQKRKARKRKRQRRHNQEPVIACQEVFAFGLRNPFRIAFDPDDTDGAHRFYINDVGEQTWEEINAGQAGANYGWDVREGPCPKGESRNCKRNERFVNPIHAYRHDATGCRSITGGAFVPNDGTDWPNDFDDSYIFADYVCDKLFRLRDTGNGVSVQQFGEGETATHLAFGPDDALYYTAFAFGEPGEVRRIIHNPQ